MLAVIQARGGSKGIPKKNIYKINNNPLISYSIYAALNSKYIDQLIVSTDSNEIKKVAEDYGAEVPFLRPKKLAKDKVASVDSLYHAVKKYEKLSSRNYDFIIELPCVSPFRNSNDIDCALEKLLKTKANSVISVCNTGDKHPVRLKKIIKDQILDFCKEFPESKKGSRRQDLDDCYIRNGAIYSMTRDTLINNFTRHGKDSRPFIMPSERSINIDEKFDLLLAELLIKNGFCENYPSKIMLDNDNEKFDHNKKILVTAPIKHINNKIINKIKIKANFLNSNTGIEKLKNKLKHVEYWICQPSPNFKINKNLLKYSPKLKIISSPSTGLTHIDTDYCSKVGITVKGISSNPDFKKITASSEFTFSLILSLVRNHYKSINKVRSGQWREIEDQLRSNQLLNKTIGIVGLGRIGTNVAKYCSSIGMNVLFYDPNVFYKKYTKYKNLKNMLRVSDIVLLSLEYNAQNKSMIGYEEFRSMKDQCYFVNTSRGEIVNESALITYLKKGKIKAAALDVLTNEQNLNFKSNKLINYFKQNENLIITPHIAGLTYESENIAFEIAYKNLKLS